MRRCYYDNDTITYSKFEIIIGLERSESVLLQNINNINIIKGPGLWDKWDNDEVNLYDIVAMQKFSVIMDILPTLHCHREEAGHLKS